MSIRKYIAYLRTVETGSITQAANELGYTQSAVSKMISDLEQDWQVKHLQRNDSAARCCASVFSHGSSAISCHQPGYMGAMSIIVIRSPFKIQEIIKSPDPASKIYMLINPGIQNTHTDSFSGIKRFFHYFPR